MNKKQLFLDLKKEFPNLNVFFDDLKNCTSIKIGGSALIVEPIYKSQIKRLIKWCNDNNIKYFILGNGSNVLAGDDIDSLVIKLNRFKKIKIKDNLIVCESGASLFAICSLASKYGLSGMEELYGIPGTIGGAIVMNAGSFGVEIKDVVSSVTFTDGYKFYKYCKKKLGFSYRKSMFFGSKYVITNIELKFEKSDILSVMQKCKYFFTKKKDSQPYNFPSAGSVFKRPKNDFAAKLIQLSNLKGKRIGGAEISKKHSGFIVNTGKAKFGDVMRLISLIRRTVFKNFGILLSLEIIVMGDKDENIWGLSYSHDLQ